MPRFCLLPLKTAPREPEMNFRRLQNRLAALIPRARPDLVCLPECTLTGYLYERADFARFAEPIPGATTRRMAELAAQSGVFLCFGMLERDGEQVYNTALLLNPAGEIILKHRKINEKPPFAVGTRVASVFTPWGKTSILICGDLFAARVVAQLPSRLDCLLAPMSRAFAQRSPDRQRWESEERAVYIAAAQRTGATVLLVNALETDIPEPSFGGALVVGKGEIAESPHGTDQALIWDGLG